MASDVTSKNRLRTFYDNFSSQRGLYRPVQNYFFDVDIQFTPYNIPKKIQNLPEYIEAFKYLITEADIPNVGLHVGTIQNIIIITPIGRWVSPGNSSILSNDPFALTFVDTDYSIIENFFYPWMEENSLVQSSQTFKPFVRANIFVRPLMQDGQTPRCTYIIEGAYPVLVTTPTLTQTSNTSNTRRIEFDYNKVILEPEDYGFLSLKSESLQVSNTINSSNEASNGSVQKGESYESNKALANYDMKTNITNSNSNGDLNKVNNINKNSVVLSNSILFNFTNSKSNGNLFNQNKKLAAEEAQRNAQLKADKEFMDNEQQQKQMQDNKMFGQTQEQAQQAQQSEMMRKQTEMEQQTADAKMGRDASDKLGTENRGQGLVSSTGNESVSMGELKIPSSTHLPSNSAGTSVPRMTNESKFNNIEPNNTQEKINKKFDFFNT